MVGYGLGKVAAAIRLPEITGYIVAGLLVGEAVLGVVPRHMSESFKLVTDVALGLIALTIGSEFSLLKLKRMGRPAIVITLIQLLAALAAVSLGLLLFGMPLPFALLLGAIATATAPAATVAIVQSLRAHGLFVDDLYGVVALDDAGCVILFGIVFAGVSGFLSVGAETTHAATLILQAFAEVAVSIAIGIASGFVVHALTSKKSNTGEILILTLGIVFITTAVAIVFHLSPLLTNMAAGCALINLSARNHRIFRILEPMTPPIYALFFVVAGTELNPAILTEREVLFFGPVYVVFRALGKYGGVYLGARMSGVLPRIRDYLGLCMLPQAGVAIGLVLLIEASPISSTMAPEHLDTIGTMVNIVLLSVFVNELIGPPLARLAILRGNDMEA
jgi:Kef-type K+ transport system membrane component KefB